MIRHSFKEGVMRAVARWTRRLVLPTLLLAAALAWPLAASQTAKPEDVGFSSERLHRVHDLVQRHIDAGNVSGAVTLVARDGRVAHFEAQGVMDLASKKPMTRDAIFRIMSMTKPIVGVSILMLVEEGKVRLSDPLSRFVPELKDLKVAVAQPGQPAPAGSTEEIRFDTVKADREITIRDLLTHTSGLMSGRISSREAAKVALKGQETLADFLPRLASVPLEFQPGTRWAYSATGGFDALARVVEIASGRTVAQFFKERIFDPLGMKDTFFYPAEGNPRLVTRYSRTSAGLEPQSNPSFMNGAYFSGGGGLMSTAGDYLQFAQMLLNRGELNGRRLLAPRSVELMSSAVAPDSLPGRSRGEAYGLSVRVMTDPAAAAKYLSPGSFGWSGAYGTHFWVDPKEKLVAVLMVQTPGQIQSVDFETAVMQALVSAAKAAGTH
jgi:CubicO group peptidase (beta-lactamase class C family)